MFAKLLERSSFAVHFFLAKKNHCLVKNCTMIFFLFSKKNKVIFDEIIFMKNVKIHPSGLIVLWFAIPIRIKVDVYVCGQRNPGNDVRPWNNKFDKVMFVCLFVIFSYPFKLITMSLENYT
jgi:hypothetical protein